MSELSRERQLMLEVAWKHHGTLYTWGGENPMEGFDCSGLVVECCKSIGRLPRGGDWTAEGLRQRFTEINYSFAKPGDLVFWMRGGTTDSSGRASHVGILWDPITLYLAAEGGGSSTMSRKNAIKANAFIKLRPVTSRGSTITRVYATPF